MGGDNKLGMACMILAMAHQRSGGHAEAKAALEQGLAIVARKSKQPNSGRTLLDWHDWLTFLTLARKARDWSIRPASRLVRRRANNEIAAEMHDKRAGLAPLRYFDKRMLKTSSSGQAQHRSHRLL